MNLTFRALRRANLHRLPQFKDATGRPCHARVEGKPWGFDWALSQWSNAVSGEVGEACNVIKKIERGDFTLDQAREKLAGELADVAIYLDLLAHRAGIDLGDAITEKFNAKSEQVGATTRLIQGHACEISEHVPLGFLVIQDGPGSDDEVKASQRIIDAARELYRVEAERARSTLTWDDLATATRLSYITRAARAQS